VLIFLLGLACGPKREPSPPPVAPTVEVDVAPATALDARMFEHFGYATTAQQAVIAGDLPGAKKAGALLAALPPVEGADAHWNEDLGGVRAAAGAVAASTSITEAGIAVAGLGRACGDCHHREQRGPKPPVDELGSVFNAPSEPMARHQWATTWMWFGVIGADPAAYDAGLTILAEPPTWDPKRTNPSYAGLQSRLQALAQASNRTGEDRTALYGALLGTCAACHMNYRN
jgi:cytochrome c553